LFLSVLQSGYAAEDFAHQHDQLQRALIGDAIVNAIGVLAGLQDALVAEYAQMLGDVALGGSDRVDDVLNTDFLVADDAEDLQPQRMGNRLERPGGSLDVLLLIEYRFCAAAVALMIRSLCLSSPYPSCTSSFCSATANPPGTRKTASPAGPMSA
jgi:hypothetical protein